MRTSIALVSILMGGSMCASANTVWNLLDVTFSDGASAVGSFTVNTAVTAVTAFDITVFGSSLSPSPNYHYISGTDLSVGFTTQVVDFSSSSFLNFLDLYLSTPLTNGPGTIPLLASNAGGSHQTVDCGNGGGKCGNFVSGWVTTDAIPEPASLLLTSPVVGLLGILAYRRRRRFNA